MKIHFVAICSLFIHVFPGITSGAEEVFYPDEDAAIRGGEFAGDPMAELVLVVAARSSNAFTDVRKIFLMFQVDDRVARDIADATLVLTYLETGLVVNDGDPREPFPVFLSGAAGGDWSEMGLTWENAPFHDQRSIMDERSTDLQPLAQTEVNPAAVSEDGALKFSDPALTKFLQENPGTVTFVITSGGGPKDPGLLLFDSDGTGRPERKPRLILTLE